MRSILLTCCLGIMLAQVEPRYVDPCSVNPEACSREWRQKTPGERFEAMGMPLPESRDLLYRWDDDLRRVDPDWDDDDD